MKYIEDKTFEHVTVHCTIDKAELSNNETQPVIYVLVRGEQFPMIKFVASDDLFAKGLQRNYKNLADVDQMAHHFADLFNTYLKMGKMSELYYNSIVLAYAPFIDKHRTFEEFRTKVKTVQDDIGW
jgi:hypothetical protein